MEILTSLFPFFLDWLDLVVRWIHMIVGIAWIGTSFYFNWLDSRLDREIDSQNVDGELWSDELRRRVPRKISNLYGKVQV